MAGGSVCSKIVDLHEAVHAVSAMGRRNGEAPTLRTERLRRCEREPCPLSREPGKRVGYGDLGPNSECA